MVASVDGVAEPVHDPSTRKPSASWETVRIGRNHIRRRGLAAGQRAEHIASGPSPGGAQKPSAWGVLEFNFFTPPGCTSSHADSSSGTYSARVHRASAGSSTRAVALDNTYDCDSLG